MTRFAWAAWGLLVVVLDLPLLGWDVLPDVVGYAWVVIGLAGGAALHPAFARARAAAAAGIPVALVTGTPLFVHQQGIVWGALFAEVLLTAVILHQLATGIRDLDPTVGDSDQRRWAGGIRAAAPVAGLLQMVGLVLWRTSFATVYGLGFLVMVIVGIVTVVLLNRVNRAGWLATASGMPGRTWTARSTRCSPRAPGWDRPRDPRCWCTGTSTCGTCWWTRPGRRPGSSTGETPASPTRCSTWPSGTAPCRARHATCSSRRTARRRTRSASCAAGCWRPASVRCSPSTP